MQLIDTDRAFHLLDIASDIIEAAEATGDEALQIDITGHAIAVANIDHCLIHLRHLAERGFEFSELANQVRLLLHNNEGLAAHFLDNLDRQLHLQK